MAFKSVVFDFGGVLFDWNPRYVYQNVFNDDAKMEDFLTRVCPMSWNLEMDLGKSAAQACAERKKLFPEYAKEIDLYQTHWDAMFREPFYETHAILKELSQKYPIYGLTNWPGERLPGFMKKNADVFSHIKGIVNSTDEKVAKPDARIYQALLERYNLKAEETVFTDDSAMNIEGAKNVGIYGIQYKSPEQLRGAFKDIGML